MMLARTLNLQEPLIAAIPRSIDLQINLIIKFLFRVEHENEHFLTAVRFALLSEREVVPKEPSYTINLLGLALLAVLVGLGRDYASG